MGGLLSLECSIKTMDHYKFDIIHGHGNISSAFFPLYRKKSRFVFTLHNRTPWMLPYSSLKQTFRKSAFNLLDLRIIRHVNRVIALSENMRSEITGRFGIDPSRVVTIPNGVDSDIFFPFKPNSESIKRKFGIDCRYALFVGRLVEEKAVHTILNAIAGTNVHLVIAGSGPLLPVLQDLAKHHNIEKQVHFVGLLTRNELPILYSNASLFLLPSVAEGLPLTALEAMSSGLPVIASYTSGMDDVISDGYNGFKLDPNDVQTFRKKIIQILADSSLKESIGKHSRETVKTRYSWGSIAQQTLDLYREILCD